MTIVRSGGRRRRRRFRRADAEFRDRTPEEIRLLLADLAMRYQGGFAVQTVSSLALCLSLLGAPQQPTVLFVTSSHCPHCDVMKPVLARMQQEGYRIETIQGDQNLPLVRRLGVSGYPTFLLMENGEEIDRLVGSKSYESMVAFAAPARQSRSAAPPRELTDLMRNPSGPAEVGPTPPPVPGYPQGPAVGTPADYRAGVAVAIDERAVERALGATVRIKIDEGGSVSYGTGVIVDVHRSAAGTEALILTCGHIFRDSQGKATLTVDFPTRQDNQPVPGRLLEYVAKDADIGAIYVQLPFAVEPAPVAGDQHVSKPGDPVFSVGCDQGGPARVMRSEVTSIDRYIGPPNIEASGAPSLGRSGGGLFDAQGRLIGICNAMDAADDEGIYASLPLIHWQLANLGMADLYRVAKSDGALPINPLLNTAPGAPEIMGISHEGHGPPEIRSLPYEAPVDPQPSAGPIATITLKDPSRPGDPGHTFTMQPSPDLLRQLERERLNASTLQR